MTGDGIVMAKEIGAALIGMGQIQLLPLADPVTGSTSNIIGEGTNMYVNQEGKRFVNESSRRDVLAKAILKQTGSYCYVISTFQNSRMDSDYKNNYHLYLTDLIAGAVVRRIPSKSGRKIGCPVDTFGGDLHQLQQVCRRATIRSAAAWSSRITPRLRWKARSTPASVRRPCITPWAASRST
ncbi:MAG: FAD-binding protein [Christensenellales bacterium]